MLRFVLLCLAVLAFLLVAATDLRFLGLNGLDHPLGVIALGLALFAAAFVDVPDRVRQQ